MSALVLPPTLVIGPPPKSTLPLKAPVTATLPSRSMATEVAESAPVLPQWCDQTGAPAEEYFATNASVPPAVLTVPAPKSVEPSKLPAATTSPVVESAARLVTHSLFVPPILLDQMYPPV